VNADGTYMVVPNQSSRECSREGTQVPFDLVNVFATIIRPRIVHWLSLRFQMRLPHAGL